MAPVEVVALLRSYQVFFLSHLQKCDTWCNIAYVHEKAEHDYEEIEDAYMKALTYAEQSGKPQVVVRSMI